MNNNILMIDTIFCSSVCMAPTPGKAGMGTKDKQISLKLDDEQSAVAPCERIESYNIDYDIRKSRFKRTLNESDHMRPEKTKTKDPIENQDVTRSEESGRNGQTKLESASWAEEHAMVAQSSEAESNAENKTQTSPNTKSQTDSFPLVTKEVIESAHNDEKPTTVSSLMLAEAKTSETHLSFVEANSEKRMPTDEAIPELQYPKDKELTHTGDNLSNAPGPKALNVGKFHTFTDQSEAQSGSTDNDFQQNFEQIHIQNNNPILIIQQSITSAEDTKMSPSSDQLLPNEICADVGKQILESIQSSLTHQDSNQQITVRLNPPELGKVYMKFQRQNSELTGLLEVNKAETRTEIEHVLPQMIRNLADSGIQIKRLDVMLSEENRSGYGAFEGQSPQENESYEQDSTDSQLWDNDAHPSETYEWSPNNKSYKPISELQQILVSDGSINVLV